MSGRATHRARPRIAAQAPSAAGPGQPVGPRYPVGVAATAFGLLAAVTTTLHLAGGSSAGLAAVWVANVGSLLLAAGAAVGCRLGGRRATDPASRRGWLALAAGCGAWAAGQLVWSVLESVLGQATPYPSAADVGYLCFPAAALAGFCWLARAPDGPRVRRRILDSFVVADAVALAAWLAVLSEVIGQLALSVPELIAALVYPFADLVLITLAALTAAQSPQRRRVWTVLGAAMLAMLISDTLFALLNATGGYNSGTPADWGWWAAFCLVGVAGATADRDPVAPPAPAPAEGEADTDDGRLAFAALVAAGGVVAVHYANGNSLDVVGLVMVVVLVALVLGRQYLTVQENRGLARTVQRREAQLQHLAFHDPLTGLANRALFLDRLGHALDLAVRERRPVSVVFVDLDGFKVVNDSLGHAMGDALLVAVAQRLRAALRSVDTLARLGGDEFAVIVEQGADAAVMAQALLAAVRVPVPVKGRTIAVTASIGVATTEPGRVEHAAGLLHRADVAMYAVKAAGKGDVAVHSLELDEGAPRPRSGRPPLGRALAAGLRTGEVYPVFQPAVDPMSGRIRAFEALARWTHNGEPIGPDVFVPICEEAGLSEVLTTLMLEQSCAQLATWSRALEHHDLGMAVNISPTELGDPDLPVRIEELLRRHGLRPTQLALEITESTLPNRPGVVLDVLHRLRASGIRLALDDFGTGYSTLVRLATTPVDTVKIDRFFVADIDHDAGQLRFLQALVELTRRLGLRMVAEGVERPGQLVELRRLGCGLVQGYLLSRPATAAELTPAVLQERSLLPAALLPARL